VNVRNAKLMAFRDQRGRGQLVGLIGPNGAAKTTFVDAGTGFVRYTGHLELDGRDLACLSPHARARLGTARTGPRVKADG
jgi:ABC-type branched-subunit amino acid transport system ATPase component